MRKFLIISCLVLLAIIGISPVLAAGWFQPTPENVWAYTEVLNKNYSVDGDELTGWQAQYNGEAQTTYNFLNPLNLEVTGVKFLKGNGQYQSGTYTAKVKCLTDNAGGGFYVQTSSVDVSTSGQWYTINFNNGTCGGFSTSTTSGSAIPSLRFPDGAWPVMNETLWYAEDYFPPVLDFVGTPTEGTSPLSVSFTHLSTGATGYTWSASGPGGYWFNSTTAKNPIAQFYGMGNYTITHTATYPGGNTNTTTKTDYIRVINSTATNTLSVTAINALSAFPIHGAQVDLFDVENTSWTNTTTTDGTGSITTLKGHHVNAYASATGFTSNDKLSIPVETQYESILMFPPGWTNVTGGNATLYVYVYDSTNHALPISGANVVVVSPSSSSQGTTSAAGMAQFTIKNGTSYLINVEALGQGYKTATQMASYTGVGGGSASTTVTFYLSKNTVTPTATVTTLPGGGLPTTAPTVDAYPCDADHPENCQRKQTDMANLVVQYGPQLILLFILATIFGVVKMMGK